MAFKIRTVALIAALIIGAYAQLDRTGRWDPIIDLPLIPAAAALIPRPDGSAALFMYSAYDNFLFGGARRYTQSVWYDVETEQLHQWTIDETGHDMFCPGMSYDEDGQLVVTGGSNAEVTSIYNTTNGLWTKAPDMILPRGYQTSTLTSENKVFTIGGSWSGGTFIKDGEIFDPWAWRWDMLPGARSEPSLTADVEGLWRSDNHAWLYGWRDGWVFQAGPSRDMHWYDTKGEGSVSFAGRRVDDKDQMCASNVMFEAGRILSAGGAQSYINSDGFADTHVITFDEPNAPATAKRVAPMSHPRAYSNAVALPDGKVLVTGGQTYAKQFTDDNSVLIPELWDPATEAWTEMAAEDVPRNYHSVSILLPDARVFTGGGGLCFDEWTDSICPSGGVQDHPNGQIFEPPYLFEGNERARRPVITNMSARTVALGGQFVATLAEAPAGQATFSLVRVGSATHSINSDQRRVSMTPVASDGAAFSFALNDESGALLPGYWMFFAMIDGVPSVSRTIQVRRQG